LPPPKVNWMKPSTNAPAGFHCRDRGQRNALLTLADAGTRKESAPLDCHEGAVQDHRAVVSLGFHRSSPLAFDELRDLSGLALVTRLQSSGSDRVGVNLGGFEDGV
jgi:hypothetical protein